MPSRTLSPRISTTVTVISLLITILSFFFLDSTNIAAYPSWKSHGAGPREWFPRPTPWLGRPWLGCAGEDPLPLTEPGVKLLADGPCTAAGRAHGLRALVSLIQL